MKKIYRIEDVPEKEEIYLSKDFLGWHIVHPSKNPDGSFNWFNFIVGGWSNLIAVLFVLLLLALFFLAYHEVAQQLTSCLANESVKHINISEPILNVTFK